MNKKQEIEKEITRKKELILAKLEQKHQILKIMSGYEEDIIELKYQLKKCDELKLVSGYGFGYREVNKQEYMLDVENGRCYPTKELAEIAMKNSNTRNKLEAYSRVIDPEWREVWNEGQYNYFICKAPKGNYVVTFHHLVKYFGMVYMSEKSAQRIVQALNSKEITI